MPTTRTRNRITTLTTALQQCQQSPYLFNKLQQAKASLKRQIRKSKGTQTKLSIT